ncbi:MAG: antibiotic biosynthesis monooxygenase [Gammaproteobacteria bacterium]|nr:antibiotic biosynthesis monooxygenase [Gammaproteobacteria bacterium]
MTTIQKDNTVFTVIIEITTEPEYQAELVQLSQGSLDIMATMEGFLSASLYRSHDGTKIIRHIHWRNRQDHDNCIKHPRWIEEGRDIKRFIDQGRGNIIMKTYDSVINL